MEQTTPRADDQPLPPPATFGPRHDTAGEATGFFGSLRRVGVVRSQDRWIGGVAAGVARRLGIDPLLVRGLLIVTALLGGAGLVLYGLAWALLPEEVDGRIHLQETVQGRFDAAILGALAFVIVGANRGAGWNGWWDDAGFGWINGLLWLAALGAVIAIVVAANNQRRDRSPGPSATWAPPPPPRPGTARTTPHPGYGAVPLTSPSPRAGADAGWSSTAPPPSAWPSSAGGAVPPTATAATPPPPPSAPAFTGGPSGPATGVPGTSGATAMWSAQPAAPPPPAGPPRPPHPPRPRVLGPGVGMVGTVVGLTLLTLAGLLVLDREGELGQPVALTALGIGIVLAGLAIMVSGLRGRRSGTLGFLAVLAIIAAIPAAVLPRPVGMDVLWGDVGGAVVSSDDVWRPGTVAEARRGLAVRVGDVRVDLTDVPLDGGTVEVPIRVGAGDLEVLVPEDVAVTGEIALTAGEVTWDIDGRRAMAGFPAGRSQVYSSDEAADGDADLAIRITVGVGDVRVVEEDR